MGTNPQGLPVIKQDFMWACFVTDRFSALDCVRAFVLFIEENIVMAPTLLGQQMIVVSYGGFCPADWGKSFAATLQDNYPERLVRAVIWPVPDFLCKVVRSFCYLFASKELNAKIAIETKECKMLDVTRLSSSELPDYMQGGIEAIVERDKPDPELMRKLVMDGFRSGGRNDALQGWPWSNNPEFAEDEVQVHDHTISQKHQNQDSFDGLGCLLPCLGRTHGKEEGRLLQVRQSTQKFEPAPADARSSTHCAVVVPSASPALWLQMVVIALCLLCILMTDMGCAARILLTALLLGWTLRSGMAWHSPSVC